MRFDPAQLSRTLDLWAAMWQPRERDVFAAALERVLRDGARDLKRVALAACYAIGTPRLLQSAADSVAEGAVCLDDALTISAEVEAESRLIAHAAKFTRDRAGITFLVDKVLRDNNPVSDKLLDRVDIRDLWALLQSSDDDTERAELTRRIARRGPHQRARLCTALDLQTLDDALSIDVPLDDLAPELPRMMQPLDDSMIVPLDDIIDLDDEDAYAEIMISSLEDALTQPLDESRVTTLDGIAP